MGGSGGRSCPTKCRQSVSAHDEGMNDNQFGARVRAVRIRLGWRQSDVAEQARVCATTVGRVEHGDLDHLQVGAVRSVLKALEIDMPLQANWRGGDLDRLVDESHAQLVGVVAALLGNAGWSVQVEVSFSVYGERGSIDLLAWHPPTRTLLVVEVKTSLNSVEETLRRQDVKVRLARGVALERFGWKASAAASMLVLPDDTTSRRRVERHRAVLGQSFPVRGAEARSWVRSPSGAPRLLLFLSPPSGKGLAPTRRVRNRKAGQGAAVARHRPGAASVSSPPGGA